MLERAGVVLAAVALTLGASAAADGGTTGGGLWDRSGPAGTPRAGGLTAEGRAAMGACELAVADRAATASRRCIACHDGSAGASIEFRMGADRNGMSHP